MADMFNLPSGQGGAGNTVMFTVPARGGPTLSREWVSWTQPLGITMINIIAIGGGGGGGFGFSDVASSNRGGGGGAGSAGMARLLIPAVVLPKTIYIQVGAGGEGAIVGGAAASNGYSTYISMTPSYNPTVTAANYLLRVDGGILGGNGTAVAGGGGGAGGPVPVLTNAPLGGLGQFLPIAGDPGTAGGAPGVAGTNKALPVTGTILTGGMGGGGVAVGFKNGGFISTAGGAGGGPIYIAEQKGAQAVAASANGSSPAQIWRPFYSMGGGGGASGDPLIGGSGGTGAIGAGGGGGGAGTTGGNGGPGGSGIVILSFW